MEFETFSRAVQVPFHGTSLRVVGLEVFVAMKLFAGDPQDIEDARRVVEIAGNNLDTVLLERLDGQRRFEEARNVSLQ